MTQTSTNLITQTIGLDTGDRRSVAIVLSPAGEVLEELITYAVFRTFM